MNLKLTEKNNQKASLLDLKLGGWNTEKNHQNICVA